MTQQIKNILDENFKDDSPKNTVERIKRILQQYGLETVEKWSDSGVPSCYSLRVSVEGTAFGVNGKGVTEELSLASGYGELIERLQLGRVLKGDQQKDGGLQLDCSHDGYATVEELLSCNKKFYTTLVNTVKDETGVEITEEEILNQYCNEDGKIRVASFYCVNTRSVEYIPSALINSVYVSNGCAAGNTPEEAIVQAISEILERHFSTRIMAEGISVPDIPEDVLKSCPVSYEIIEFLRSQNFRVVIKDCSLGTKYPVVCACLIDQNTGKYHSHFGAYPNFEIALQRTLTEAFQGRNIEEVAEHEKFAQYKFGEFDLETVINQVVYGTSERKPEFFINTAEPYGTVCGFSGNDNRELLKECIDFLVEQGCDVLIRDHSCLGFPTCQVVVPGWSEMFVHRILPKYNDTRYRKYAQEVLRDPASASMEEIMGFFMHSAQNAKRNLTRTFSRQANLPMQLTGKEEAYLMNATVAYLSYALGRNKDTIKHINAMLSLDISKDKEKLICIKRYLTLSKEYEDRKQVRKILEYFHTPETVSWLYSAVADKKNLLDSFVLHCDLKCDASCMLSGVCMKKQTDALSKLIKDKSMQLDRTVLKQYLEDLLQ